MNFTYPAFLFALSAIVIPIIIHLFNFRKFKTVYFSNVKFLKEVKQETQSKSKLKHLLILIARILAITFLVLAFAQPFIPNKNKTTVIGNSAVSIFIDNSFSMDAVNSNGTLLDDAKKWAEEVIAAYKPTDRFQILTNDFEAKHQRLVNKEELSDLLDEIRISPISRTFSEINSRIADVLNNAESKNKQAYIISDFQKSIFDIDKLNADTNINIHLIPITAAEKSNVYIDTCWFESPVRQLGANEKLHVRLKNSSDKEYESNAIKLFVNGNQKTPSSFNIKSQSEAEVVLAFASKETGTQHCFVEINDYPITFDDKFYFSYNVAKYISVLSINASSNTSENGYLNRLFASDSNFIYKAVSENQIDYGAMLQNNLVIFNQLKTISSGLAQEIQKFVLNGGSLLVFPADGMDMNSYNALTSALNVNAYEKLDTANTKVDNVNTQSDIYKDVFDKKTFSATSLDLPKVFEHYVVSKKSRSSEEYLMKLQTGDVFIAKYSSGKGAVFLSAVPLNEKHSNFVKHAMFVPTLYKISITSQMNSPLFYTIGHNQSVELENHLSGENIYKIKNINSNFEMIPEHRLINLKMQLLTNNQIKEAGNYNIIQEKESIAGISFNYDRNESDLACHSPAELKDIISQKVFSNISVLELNKQSLTNVLADIEQGTKLWKLCIILALLFLALEIILIRFLK